MPLVPIMSLARKDNCVHIMGPFGTLRVLVLKIIYPPIESTILKLKQSEHVQTLTTRMFTYLGEGWFSPANTVIKTIRWIYYCGNLSQNPRRCIIMYLRTILEPKVQVYCIEASSRLVVWNHQASFDRCGDCMERTAMVIKRAFQIGLHMASIFGKVERILQLSQ